MGGIEKGIVAFFCGAIVSGILGAGTYTLLQNEILAVSAGLLGIPVVIIVYKVFA